MWVVKDDRAVNLDQTNSFSKVKDLIIFNHNPETDADILEFESKGSADIAFDAIVEALVNILPVLLLE